MVVNLSNILTQLKIFIPIYIHCYCLIIRSYNFMWRISCIIDISTYLLSTVNFMKRLEFGISSIGGMAVSDKFCLVIILTNFGCSIIQNVKHTFSPVLKQDFNSYQQPQSTPFRSFKSKLKIKFPKEYTDCSPLSLRVTKFFRTKNIGWPRFG